MEEDHVVFADLPNRGKTERKTAQEKPKQEDGLSWSGVRFYGQRVG